MAYSGKTNWTNNEIVEAADMNRIEQGITDNDTGLATHKNNASNPHSVTAAQVGAVSKSGDTMTGALTVPRYGLVAAAGDGGGGAIVLSKPAGSAYDDIVMDVVGDKLRFWYSTGANLGAYIDMLKGGGAAGAKIYHSGDKPTPEEIGALKSTSGSFTPNSTTRTISLGINAKIVIVYGLVSTRYNTNQEKYQFAYVNTIYTLGGIPYDNTETTGYLTSSTPPHAYRSLDQSGYIDGSNLVLGAHSPGNWVQSDTSSDTYTPGTVYWVAFG